jgi:hypothetical protein
MTGADKPIRWSTAAAVIGVAVRKGKGWPVDRFAERADRGGWDAYHRAGTARNCDILRFASKGQSEFAAPAPLP